MIAGVTLQQATVLSARQDVAAIRSTPVSHKAPKATGARMAPVTQAAAGIPFPMVPEYSSEPSLVDMAAGRKVVIVTGASSGVGLAGAKALADKGWFVVMANRDYLKSKKAAKRAGIPEGSYCVIHCDLAAFDSVRQFVADFQASGLPLDAMVANAAVYKPLLTEPERTAEGFELCVGTNHLGHFLMLNLLLEDLAKSKNNPRCVILGTVTHNPDELGGKIPPQANLGDLSGMAKGLKGTISMIDGKEFSAPKAYKDSKVCNVLTMKEMHKRFHQSTGVVFSSFYPGCVATTPLFRNHLPLFQSLFPVFHKNVTGAFVSEELAGERLAEVVADPKYTASGSYWTWGGRQKVGRDSYQRKASKEAEDDAKGEKLWDISMELCGLKA